MKNISINYLYTAIIITLTGWIIFSSDDFKNIPYLYKIIDKSYILLALLCMAFFWITETFIFKFTFAFMNTKNSLKHSFKLTMIGQYYNLITPFSTGGQPAQIYSMTNDYKIPLGQATSITINKFMVYHIIITFYSIIMFIIKRDYVANELATGRSFIYFGLILNSLGIIAIFAILYNSVIAEKTIVVLIKILQKFNLAKNVKSETISKHILEYKTSLYEISNNKKILIIVSLLTTLQITVYFSVTYFVYLSLGLRKYSYFDILAVQTLLYMAVNFIPTPGNSGASEGGFYLLFALIFPHSVLLYAIVLWRLVVFYFNLLATGSIVLGDQILKRLKPKF